MPFGYAMTEEQELLLASLREWYAQNLNENIVKEAYVTGQVPEEVTASTTSRSPRLTWSVSGARASSSS